MDEKTVADGDKLLQNNFPFQKRAKQLDSISLFPRLFICLHLVFAQVFSSLTRANKLFTAVGAVGIEKPFRA